MAMDNQWSELISFIFDRTFIPRRRINRILDVYAPEPLPESLQEVLQDILMEKKVTREGVAPLTKYAALSALINLETEQANEEILQFEGKLGEESLADSAIDAAPEAFLEYSNLIEKICSMTGEDEETIHQVHRAYLEYVYMKTNNPDTLVPFLKWYLDTEEDKL